MVRPVADGQLTAPPGVRLMPATPADEAAIRRLLRENPLRGRISLTLEREPDYFLGSAIGGAEDETLLARAGGQLVGVGRCVTRPCWLNGTVQRVGYFAELRLAAAARGRPEIARQGFGHFRARHQADPAALYFTSIAADNTRARRLLERGLPGWPRYEFLTEYRTLVLATRRARGTEPGAARGSGATPSLEEIADFLQRAGSRCQLAPVWTAERLRLLARHGLHPEDFHVRREAGRIVACAALWDQRGFRQVVVRGYSGALGRLRPALNLLARLLDRPRLPAPGEVLAQAGVSPCAIDEDHVAHLPALLATLRDAAARRGLTHLTLGLAADHPGLALARAAYPGRIYSTRLYRVHWPADGPPLPLEPRRFAPEIALL